jgi:CRISPR type II-A-associated protein Csn2
MKLAFQKFENQLELKKGFINILRIEDKKLFANCAQSMACGFAPDVLEPATFYEGEKALKPKDCLYFVGDLLTLDLNDKKIIAAAIKKIISMMVLEDELKQKLECAALSIEEEYENQTMQLSADYVFANDWDDEIFLKAFGFRIDDADCKTLFDRLKMFFRIAADLFPQKVLAFVNLDTFLSDEQYDELKVIIAAEELIVFSYESGPKRAFTNFENGLFVDADYLEE